MADLEHKFKAGDVVRLKSGGPKMTVSCAWVAIGGVYVKVHWVRDYGSMEEQSLHQDELKPV